MQLKLLALCTGLVLASSLPAMAQGTPIYNTNTGGGTPYYAAQNGYNPVYNNGTNVSPIPLQQMIAGKNAPSYTIGGNNAYRNFGNNNPMSGVTSIGSLSPEQANYLRAQQARADQLYAQQQQQSQYGQQQNSYSSAYQGGAFSQLYTNNNSPFGNKADSDIPTKRRVVYKEANNPLVEPPRLFNPDQ